MHVAEAFHRRGYKYNFIQKYILCGTNEHRLADAVKRGSAEIRILLSG
jgi:hypothetical protein